MLLLLLYQEITYPLLFLRGTSGVGGEEICSAPTPLQEINYPLLFLRGTSGVGGEKICATATPLPRNNLPEAVPAWNLWCRG